jgi:HPr kinase/phosphorylase
MNISLFVERANKKYNLDLETISGEGGLDKRVITTVVTNRPGLALVGFFENFAYDRVQIIGKGEQAYIRSAYESRDRDKISKIESFLDFEIPCCIVSDYKCLPDGFLRYADERNIPILASSLDTYQLTFSVELILNYELAPSTVVNGVMFDIYDYGVLIIGKSGIGKSEIALELLSRKHRFVADDLVLIRKIRYPEGYKAVAFPYVQDAGLVEIRGIGVLNVEELLGLGFIIPKKEVDIVIELVDWDDSMVIDRLGTYVDTYEVLGIKLNKKVIPVAPGRNIPFLIEIAIISERIKRKRESDQNYEKKGF